MQSYDYFYQTTLRLESFDVGTLVATFVPFMLLLVTYIDRFTEMSGSWLFGCWIWLLLLVVWTLGSFTDWFVARLFPLFELLFPLLYWLLRFITLLEATILLLPVIKAGRWLLVAFTAWERLRFFCCYNYFVFSCLASSAKRKATVLAIFLIC